MNNDMKCPFCGAELKNDVNLLGYSTKYWYCENTDCSHLKDSMREDIWQELIRTRKALDVAVDALKEYEDRDSYDCNGDWCGCEYSTAHKALEQITALEQKDAK